MGYNCGDCMLVTYYMIYGGFAIGCNPSESFDILGHIVILKLGQVFVREGVFNAHIYIQVSCYNCGLIIYSV